MKRIKQILVWLLLLIGAAILSVFGIDQYVKKTSKDSIYTDVGTIPYNKVGMVLGTAKYLAGGYINLYYKYRIDATVALYNAGKIEYVLVSGDNGKASYDEPTTFKADLVARGIPEEKIFLDYAGFRTLDSIIRGREVFQENKFTVISQRFHNERAICIGRFHDMDLVAFSAKDVSKKYAIKVTIREYFARVKMMLDLLVGKEPRFLGDKITIQ